MRPAGAPFPNCHNLGSSGISAYLHELCTHLSPSPPPFLDIGQISLTQSVKLGGPSHLAPQLLRTKQLLVSSPSCCPRPRTTHWCTTNTVLYMFITCRKHLSWLFLFRWRENILFPCGQLLYFLLAVSICVLAWVSTIQPYPRWPACLLQLIVESPTCILICTLH